MIRLLQGRRKKKTWRKVDIGDNTAAALTLGTFIFMWRISTDEQFSLEQCAYFLCSRLYVKSHFLELSQSFGMTAAGRPLQPHPMSFLPPSTHPHISALNSLSLLSTRISMHTLHHSCWVDCGQVAKWRAIRPNIRATISPSLQCVRQEWACCLVSSSACRFSV